jgi:hypothetical protein
MEQVGHVEGISMLSANRVVEDKSRSEKSIKN